MSARPSLDAGPDVSSSSIGGAVDGVITGSGIEPGERVAALLPNVPKLLEMHFAAPAARAVFVPINVRVSATELAYILEHGDARLLVTHPSLAETVDEAVATLAHPPRVIMTRMAAGDGSATEDRLAAAAPIPITAPAEEIALLRSITRAAPPAGRRASCTATAAPTCRRLA